VKTATGAIEFSVQQSVSAGPAVIALSYVRADRIDHLETIKSYSLFEKAETIRLRFSFFDGRFAWAKMKEHPTS
jgi:hypothetical protein